MSNLRAVDTAKRTRRNMNKSVDDLRAAAGLVASNQRKHQPPKMDDEREMLVMLRNTLKSRIAEAPTHTLAALVKQFREVDKEIRTIDAKVQHDAEEASEATDEVWDDDSI